MKQCVIVGTNTLVQMARQLWHRGAITDSQMQDIEIRNNLLVPDEWKKDVIELQH